MKSSRLSNSIRRLWTRDNHQPETSSHNEELSEAVSAATDRLQNDGWPFPISGGDKKVAYNGTIHNGWYLASAVHEGSVFLLDNGNLVIKTDQWSNKTTKFKQDAASTELSNNTLKSLRSIATVNTDNEGNAIKFTPLPPEKWGRQAK